MADTDNEGVKNQSTIIRPLMTFESGQSKFNSSIQIKAKLQVLLLLEDVYDHQGIEGWMV